MLNSDFSIARRVSMVSKISLFQRRTSSKKEDNSGLEPGFFLEFIEGPVPSFAFLSLSLTTDSFLDNSVFAFVFSLGLFLIVLATCTYLHFL